MCFYICHGIPAAHYLIRHLTCQTLWWLFLLENERVSESCMAYTQSGYNDLYWLKTTNKFFVTKWQKCWNNNINNKLFQIKPTLGEWRPAFRKSRMEQIIISRLRIDHTRLTLSFSSRNSHHSVWHVRRFIPLNIS